LLPPSLTKLLELMKRGDRRAREAVYEQSYDELKAIARRLLRREQQEAISPTELVNEAFVRKLKEGKFTAQNRGHFYAIATRAMRAVLVEQARQRLAAKRNHGRAPEPLEGLPVPAVEQDPLELLALEEQMEELESLDARAAEVFGLRFFLGYTLEETAGILGQDAHRVREDWEYAKAWLRDRVNRELRR